MIDIVLWGLVALPYSYLLSRGCSWAYYESKFEYHKKVVQSYEKVME